MRGVIGCAKREGARSISVPRGRATGVRRPLRSDGGFPAALGTPPKRRPHAAARDQGEAAAGREHDQPRAHAPAVAGAGAGAG